MIEFAKKSINETKDLLKDGGEHEDWVRDGNYILELMNIALAALTTEPLGWIHEDELPEKYPYDAMFPYSKVDIVRMFPVFGPPAASRVPDGWKPIATAPRDKTEVLLRDSHGRHANGYWLPEAFNGNGAWIWPYVHANPNYWMPLPALPSLKSEPEPTQSNDDYDDFNAGDDMMGASS